MSQNLVSFIKGLLPSFDKSDLESDLELSLEAISGVIESYNSLEEIFKVAKVQDKRNKDIIKEFYKEFDNVKHKVKLSPGKNLGTDVVTLFKNVKINGDFLYKEISDAVNDVIVSQAITAAKANLLRAVAHYNFMTRFGMDLVNFFYVNESENSGMEFSKEYKLNKKQSEFIVKNLWIFARLLAVYGDDHNAFKDKINKIENITLPKDSVDEVIDSYNSDKLDVFDNLPSNFIGSPIYSVRLIYAQWEADRYKNIKDKKKLLELRYLHLKLVAQQNQTDVNLEKQIEALQKRIVDYDYTLSKIEEDIHE